MYWLEWKTFRFGRGSKVQVKLTRRDALDAEKKKIEREREGKEERERGVFIVRYEREIFTSKILLRSNKTYI